MGRMMGQDFAIGVVIVVLFLAACAVGDAFFI
jgi:hypothetical protein